MMGYAAEYVFWGAAILGILLMAWMGWSQGRQARGLKRELQREKGLREWLSHEPVRRSGSLDPLSELRVIAVEATRDAELFERFVEDAHSKGDEELAGFFADAADWNDEIADRAVDLLRDRLPPGGPPLGTEREPPPPAP